MPCQGLYGCSKNAILSATSLPFSARSSTLLHDKRRKKPARSRAVLGPISATFHQTRAGEVEFLGQDDVDVLPKIYTVD